MQAGLVLRHHWSRARHWTTVCLLATVFCPWVARAAIAQAGGDTWPQANWAEAKPAEVGMDAAPLQEAKRYAASAGGSGMVIRHGKVVLRWGDQHELYDIKSATKSFGSTLLGVAIADGKVRLEDPATKYHSSFGLPPQSNAETGWLDKITLRQLANQTAGFEKPGGYEKLLFEPGTQWHYSDGGPNWLAECLTLVYRQDLETLMFQRVFEPIGIERNDLRWRKNQYRDHELDGIPRREFGAGIHANVEALSRFGYLYLREGLWRDQQILSKEFVRQATSSFVDVVDLPEWDKSAHRGAPAHYGLLWWNNADGVLEEVPRDAYWAWGLYDSLIVVIPSLDVVVVRGGARGRQLPREVDAGHYDVLQPLLVPIVAAVRDETQASAPVPKSEIVAKVTWAPRDQIIRLASGSDNWPLTWGDDDYLYTAYGDGWGVRPRVERKLSLGLARIAGSPPDISGQNLRSETAETLGDGPRGKKASGMLMIEGVLYMFVRNADNSQLAWSTDHGKTWQWADWRFTTSFGCPTFLNFGQNYAGARDEFVYIYSQDSDSAYQAADRMVLARAAKNRLTDRDAYEFFVDLDENSRPRWTRQIEERGAVFTHQSRCYRSGITYNAALKRYLWCQVLPESDDERGPRFQGGFGIYDAAEPWGPWTTVYFTNRWDVGPGETCSLPTKWMSGDGRTVHLVFSGDDHFSVRRAELKLK